MRAEAAKPPPPAWRCERRGQDLYAEGPHSLWFALPHDEPEGEDRCAAAADTPRSRG
jgi:hypothetical protein